jgi:hypothetical protein
MYTFDLFVYKFNALTTCETTIYHNSDDQNLEIPDVYQQEVTV